MIVLQICALAGVLFVSPAWCALLKTEIEDYIEPMCFKLSEDGLPLVNGQENPLSQTLENFISLAEKFEITNSQLDLKSVLFYFIRNYTYDNFEFGNLGDIQKWTPKESNFDIIDTLWEPDENQRKSIPEGEDPFSEGEKCSLFYMLSHSIIRKPQELNPGRAAPMNNSIQRSYGNDFNLNNQYPMEAGVVAVLGTEVAVELGRVLKGMYVGLQENRKKDVGSFDRIPKQNIPPTANEIDVLYTLTLAEVLALATWRAESGRRENFAVDGRWISAPIDNDIDTKDICPMIYRLNDETQSAYSRSSLRGAADGFILGKIIKSLSQNRNIRLSQILRMYYSSSGVTASDQEELGQIKATFCNRLGIISPLEQKLKEQVALYQLLVATTYKTLNTSLNYAWNYYQEQKTAALQSWNTVINGFCGKILTSDKPEDLPRESPLDVLVVLDTSDGPENFKKQQKITGYLAREMDLRYSGSRMTVLTDQRPPGSTGSKSGIITLNSIVSDSESSSCVACTVTQVQSENLKGSLAEDEVILAINQYLKARKENQTNLNGVNGKVVVYFNFHENELTTRPGSLQARVDQNLRDLHLNHKDAVVYALGKSPDLLKKYTKNDIAFALSAVEEDEDVVGKKLFLRIISAPATLQYTQCQTGNNEKNAIYEDFVSPNAIQHWQMPVKYLYKSTELKFTFEAQYGPLRVCFSRATTSSEFQKNSCQDIPSGQKKDIREPNPCNKLNEYTCSPFFFSIIGINDSEETKQDVCIDTNMDNRCRTIDQIKFKVSHEGVRCSGSMGLLATPVVILLGILLHVFSKKY